MSTTGQKLPTAAQSVLEAPWSDDAWVSPANIYGAGEASVTATTFDAGDQTYVLKAYTFDMSAIPDGATIDGVIVTINARYATAVGSIDLVQLLDVTRAKVGTNKAATPQALTTSAANYTFGTSSDTWGNSLTAAWVKDADFGVAIGMLAGGTGNNNVDVYCDSVQIEVYYTPTHNPTAAIDGTSSLTAIGQKIIAITAIVNGASSLTAIGETGAVFNATATINGTSSLTAKYQTAFLMSPSDHISASGANTTAQLSAPAGKTTGDFEAGRIADDENPLDAINLTAGKYTELEWSIKPTDAAGTDVWEFRVTVAGVALDTYSVTPTLTVTLGGVTHNATAAIAGTSSLTGAGKRTLEYTAAIAGTSSLTTAGKRIFEYTASIAGISSLTSAGVRSWYSTAAIAGTSSLTGVGQRSMALTGAVAGTSSITAAGMRTFGYTATVSGTSSLTSVGKNTVSTTAAISATSSLVATGNLTGQVDFTATITGTSSLAASAQRTMALTGGIAGTSSLTSAGVRNWYGTAAIAGASSLVGAGSNAFYNTATITGTSSLTASYSNPVVLGLAYLSTSLADIAALSDAMVWSAELRNIAYEHAEVDDEPK